MNVSKVKLFSNFFFNVLWVVLMLFCFQALFKGKKVCICWVFFYFLLLETAPNFKIFQSSLRNKRCLHNGPEVACNINSLKTGKNPNIYVSSPKDKLLPVACPCLTRAELLCTLRSEILCIYVRLFQA